MQHFKLLAIFLLSAVVMLVAGCAGQPAEEEPAATEPAPAATEPEPEPEPPVAMAELQPREGLTASGTVTFTETAAGVQIVAELSGVEPAGSHGFHIHEIGDCSAEDFKSAGGHFNPTGSEHGGPDSPAHHAGDLGNIEIGEDGSGRLELVSDMLTVAEGPNSVLGRGVILHEKADDLTSQPTGAAGSRQACGVVELVGDEGDAAAEEEMSEDMGEEEGAAGE